MGFHASDGTRGLGLGRRQVVSLSIAAALCPVAGYAQALSNRPVTIVSPYVAGGTSDLIARILGEELRRVWGQPVVIENRSGANGSIGVVSVARAAADGHTLLAVASSALTINPLLYKKLSYDVEADLAPISVTGQVANVVVVNPAVEANDLGALVDLARSRPAGLTYASQGIGSNGHLNAEMFAMATGAKLVHVPYRGSAQAVSDLIGGQVDVMFDNLPTVLEHIRGGRLRALAVTSAARTSQLPDVPTVSEALIPGFDTTAWFAVLAPKGTTAGVLTRIEEDVVRVLTTPAVRARLAEAGVVAAASGSADLAARIERDRTLWADVIGRAGISVE